MFKKNNLNSIKTKQYKKYNYKTKKADVIQYGGDPKTNIKAVITKLYDRDNIKRDDQKRELLVDKDNTSIQNLYDSNIVYKLNLLIKKLNKKVLTSKTIFEAPKFYYDDILTALFVPNT